MSDTAKRVKKSSDKVVVRRKQDGRKIHRSDSGVVHYCIYGLTGKSVASEFTSSKMIEVVRVGLPVAELDYLQASLDVPLEKLFPMLGISKATFHRRKVEGRLDQAESDSVVRFA